MRYGPERHINFPIHINIHTDSFDPCSHKVIISYSKIHPREALVVLKVSSSPGKIKCLFTFLSFITVDFPLEKSQWALIFDGWVDDSVSLNHEHDHAEESAEDDHDDHSSEDADDGHDASTEQEESEEDLHSDSDQEDDNEECSESNSNADEDDENVSEDVLGSYEDVYEPGDAECDALLGESSNEGTENEWLEQLRDLEEQARILGIDLNDDESNENESGISQEDDEADQDEEEGGNDDDDENDDLSSQRGVK